MVVSHENIYDGVVLFGISVVVRFEYGGIRIPMMLLTVLVVVVWLVVVAVVSNR